MINTTDALKFEYSQFEKKDLGIYLMGGERVDKSVINNRRRLGISGALFVSINKDVNNSIELSAYGLPEVDTKPLKSEITRLIIAEWGEPDAEDKIRIGIRHYLNKLLGFKPIVFVHIL